MNGGGLRVSVGVRGVVKGGGMLCGWSEVVCVWGGVSVVEEDEMESKKVQERD